MGKSSPSAPAAPDPTTTANAQTASNEQTALYNFGLNNPSVNSPLGDLSYSVSNSTPTYNYSAYNQALQSYDTALQNYDSSSQNRYAVNGPDGYSFYTPLTPNGGSGGSSAPTAPQLSQFETSSGGNPQTTENITLSPAEQEILNLNQQNTIQQGQNAATAQNNVTNLLQTPYNLASAVQPTMSQQDQQADVGNAENALYQQQYQYLQPQFQQSQQQLQSQLANQGIPQGSQAYNTAMNNLALQQQQQNQSALNSATSGAAAYQAQLAQTGLANQAQEAQLYTQQYQEPLNLYSSLMSGTAPTMPQFSALNASDAAPTNVLGAYQNAYQGQLNAYNTQVGSQNSELSGLTGILGSLGGAAVSNSKYSDRRLKKNIRKIAAWFNGINIYEFEYNWNPIKQIGVMADEVKKIIPEAVHTGSDGYDRVNYAMVFK